ncbi:MAG: hypothetical protein AABW79_03750 [Nanoarchaeota archaeon]
MYDHEETLREMLNAVKEDHSSYFEPQQQNPNPKLSILDKNGKKLYFHKYRGRIMFGSEGMGISYNGAKDDLPLTEAATIIASRKIASEKELVRGFIGGLEEKGLSADNARLKNLKIALKIE